MTGFALLFWESGSRTFMYPGHSTCLSLSLSVRLGKAGNMQEKPSRIIQYDIDIRTAYRGMDVVVGANPFTREGA